MGRMKRSLTRYSIYAGKKASAFVHKAGSGWVVDFHSEIPGEYTQRTVLIPYSKAFPCDANLGSRWNPFWTLGDVIIQAARDGDGRVLRSGSTVTQ